jgi:DNA-binding response OmpR family regulator
MVHVLIIEDDADIALSLKYNLEQEGGYVVEVVEDGETGARRALEVRPDLVLLDLNLPQMDGLDVCRRIRSNEATSRTPIIMLTARVEESDRIRGLDLGADDYVTKPFSVKEVVARVRAVMRRADGAAVGEVLSAGELHVDQGTRRVTVSDREVSLTRREFDLLTDLMRHRGRVRTRERLLEEVWGYTHSAETRTVDVHIRQLRKKLGDSVSDMVETVVGVGYRFKVPS